MRCSIQESKPKRGWATGPTIQQFPSGLSKAPFRWDYLRSILRHGVPGGFVGVAQDQETLPCDPRSAGL